MTQLPITTETGEPRTGYVLDIFNPRTILPCEDNARSVALLKAMFGFDEHTRRFTKPLPPQPFQTELLFYILFDHVSERRTRQPHGPRKPTLASVTREARKAGLDPARIEIKPDGTYAVDIGKPEQQQSNELDEWIAKHARAPERHS
jgi:hypothetical protein